MGFIYSFATAGGREQCYCSRDLHRLTEYWARTNEAAESSWISHLTTVDNIVDGVWIVRPSPHNSLNAKLGIAAQRVVVSSHWSRIWPQRETSCSFSKDTTLTEMSVVSVGLSRPLSLSILRFSCLSWSVLSSVVSFDRFLQFSSILWLVLFFFFLQWTVRADTYVMRWILPLAGTAADQWPVAVHWALQRYSSDKGRATLLFLPTMWPFPTHRDHHRQPMKGQVSVAGIVIVVWWWWWRRWWFLYFCCCYILLLSLLFFFCVFFFTVRNLEGRLKHTK